MLSDIARRRRPRSRFTAVTHALPGNGHSRARDVAVASASAALAVGTAAGAYKLVNREKHTTAGGGDEQPSKARQE